MRPFPEIDTKTRPPTFGGRNSLQVTDWFLFLYVESRILPSWDVLTRGNKRHIGNVVEQRELDQAADVPPYSDRKYSFCRCNPDGELRPQDGFITFDTVDELCMRLARNIVCGWTC